MFRVLFVLIVVLSALEIGVFVWLGNLFSVWFVIFGIIFTGLLGAYLAKKQGVEALNRAREQMNYGNFPREEIFDGLSIFVGAILLFTPGFITDTIGFILLFPFTRYPIKRWMKDVVRTMIRKGSITIFKGWK
ncbi:UPF0716 protein FxsA [Salirhabdus euzebyi]|uniref:UPF0716 protein FxsA n=1 Tax=Salirhabdus euzebyi TaxID=394506 RepID=A0A841PSY3_9BACI|nr:FxsA family protein [Salirhabdus euzebyi]MBB6452087.1 UPF0716 protein FxsA [Salirhabdus euzebyi]